MEELLLGLVVFLGLWLAIVIIYRMFDLRRYGVTLKPFLLIVRSKALVRRFEIAYSSKTSWKIVSTLSIFVSGGLMVYALYFLIDSLMKRIVVPEHAPPPLIPLLPGITIKWAQFLYFVVAASVVILLHELFHAITMANEKIPIKSFGIFIAVFLPGGFVEADEEALKKSSPLSRMRIYASGSFSNFLTFLVVLPLLWVIPWPLLPWELSLHLWKVLLWLLILSFSVAFVNMLPIPLLDGSGFLRSLLESLSRNEKANNAIVNLLGAFSIFLLLANMGY